ncbi:MAG TPA: hypothetical protein DCQ31_17805, partial [Bacteroidales bacterium]|nr:hypothetical protein [Bacteroidales bacterium]
MATWYKFRFKPVYIIAFFLFFFEKITAQNLQPDSIALKANLLNYFRNVENFIESDPGYTLFGNKLDAVLEVSKEKTTYEFGVSAVQYFGRNDSLTMVPIIKLRHKFNPNFTLTFGSLAIYNEVKLPAMFYANETRYLVPAENGLSLKYQKSNFRLYFFTVWEKFIFWGDPYREEIFGGLHVNKTFNSSNIKLEIPLIVTAYHKGGQIDNTGLPVETDYNFSAGLKVTARNELSVSYSYNGYSNDYEQAPGYFHLAEINWQTQQFEVSVAGLSGNNWWHPKGERIYN